VGSFWLTLSPPPAPPGPLAPPRPSIPTALSTTERDRDSSDVVDIAAAALVLVISIAIFRRVRARFDPRIKSSRVASKEDSSMGEAIEHVDRASPSASARSRSTLEEAWERAESLHLHRQLHQAPTQAPAYFDADQGALDDGEMSTTIDDAESTTIDEPDERPTTPPPPPRPESGATAPREEFGEARHRMDDDTDFL